MHRPILAAVAAAMLTVATPGFAQDLEIPEGGMAVSSEIGNLPEPVRKKVLELSAIAKSGDISLLTPILQADQTRVSFGDPEDATAYLKQNSADGEGLEILALLANILEAPFAAVDGGEGPEGGSFYVWPSLAYYESLAGLSAADRVVAYQIMGYQGFEEMKGLDAWYHWRVYIGDNGQLQAFVAGD
jgi:hypothetical protein